MMIPLHNQNIQMDRPLDFHAIDRRPQVTIRLETQQSCV
jgi:hypothetical protein